jgi:hypothetical protein
VHFLRFELEPRMVAALKAGGALAAGIDHPNNQHELAIPENVRSALIADFA